MSKRYKYYVLKFDTEVLGGYDEIEDAVYAYMQNKNEGGEPNIVKPVTWRAEYTDITEATPKPPVQSKKKEGSDE